jgi:hypothetical protein
MTDGGSSVVFWLSVDGATPLLARTLRYVPAVPGKVARWIIVTVEPPAPDIATLPGASGGVGVRGGGLRPELRAAAALLRTTTDPVAKCVPRCARQHLRCHVTS